MNYDIFKLSYEIWVFWLQKYYKYECVTWNMKCLHCAARGTWNVYTSCVARGSMECLHFLCRTRNMKCLHSLCRTRSINEKLTHPRHQKWPLVFIEVIYIFPVRVECISCSLICCVFCKFKFGYVPWFDYTLLCSHSLKCTY